MRDSRLSFLVVFVILFEVFCDEASCWTNTMKKKKTKKRVTLTTTLRAKKTPIQDSSSSFESNSDFYVQFSWIFVSRVDASCASV